MAEKLTLKPNLHDRAHRETLTSGSSLGKGVLTRGSGQADAPFDSSSADRMPCDAVGRPKLVVKKGKTPILDEEQAKELLSTNDSHVVGLRGRALIAVMLYTFARVRRRSQ